MRVFDAAGVHRDLIGARSQKRPHVIDRVDAAADRERQKKLIGGTPYHIQKCPASLFGCGNIQEYDLIGTLLIVACRKLNGIACVAEPQKICSLDHAPVLDIQTGNYSFCKRHISDLFRFLSVVFNRYISNEITVY